MTKSRIFFILSLSFIGGVFVASFFYPRDLDESAVLLLAAILSGIYFIFFKNRFLGVAAMAGVIFTGGVFLTELRLEKIRHVREIPAEFYGETMIVKEPLDKGAYMNLIVWPDEMASGRQDLKFLVRTYDKKDYSYGEKINLKCLLKVPENDLKDKSTGRSFDYQMYLAKDGVFFECSQAKILRLGKNEGNFLYKNLITLKNYLNRKIQKLIPAPEAGLASGILLGGDELMSKDWQEKFSLTGMTHIVAVSGYNVTIIAQYLMFIGILAGLWRRQAFWFAIFGITFFILMIGLPSSAVRAGVMGGLLLWAAKHGRLANSQNSILLAAGVMLMVNPLLLRWDIGYQLSFLATLGIVYLYPFFEKHLVKKQRCFGLTELLFLTLSAQIFVLPVILINFERLSLISPLANVLVLPIVPASMFLVFLAVMAGFVFYPLSLILSWLAYLPLKYETFIIELLAGFQFSSVRQGLTWWELALWYIILTVLILRFRRNNNRRYLWADEN